MSVVRCVLDFWVRLFSLAAHGSSRARSWNLLAAFALPFASGPSAADDKTHAGRVELTAVAYAVYAASDAVLEAPDAVVSPTPPIPVGPNEFSLVSYNIAGLPGPISKSDPRRNVPRIGGLLNAYDIALVQEDFAYHPALLQNVRHPHVSHPIAPSPTAGAGDGLARFSRSRFRGLERHAWERCYGTLAFGCDCTSIKGVSVATHQLSPGVSLHVYNLHMDSGSSEGDQRAREAQVDQLLSLFEKRSPESAMIVAGDTNIGHASLPTLLRLQQSAGLSDACQALDCPEPERIDRILYRSSRRLRLEPVDYRIDGAFVDGDGEPLSDHDAVAARFRYTVGPR